MATMNSEQWQFLRDLSKLISFVDEAGLSAVAGHLKRTVEEQRHMVSKGLSETIDSKHIFSLAADIHIKIDGKFSWDYEIDRCKTLWECIGAYWEGLSPLNVWGGRFESLFDPDHFERDLSKK